MYKNMKKKKRIFDDTENCIVYNIDIRKFNYILLYGK